MTLETPEIDAASDAPTPPGQRTVGFPPIEVAAPTSWAVTGVSPSSVESAITVTSY